MRVGFIAAAPVDRDQPYTNTTATPTASPLPQRVAVADTSVRGSLAPGHVPAGTNYSAKTEVAGHKQDDHDESDEPNDSVHVRLPRSETGLDSNRRFTITRRRRNGSRGRARHRPCKDCNTRDDLLSMSVLDAMPSKSRCQLLAAMGGLA